jgi:hypothetical protein
MWIINTFPFTFQHEVVFSMSNVAQIEILQKFANVPYNCKAADLYRSGNYAH